MDASTMALASTHKDLSFVIVTSFSLDLIAKKVNI